MFTIILLKACLRGTSGLLSVVDSSSKVCGSRDQLYVPTIAICSLNECNGRELCINGAFFNFVTNPAKTDTLHSG